jgi:hypothetical protein
MINRNILLAAAAAIVLPAAIAGAQTPLTATQSSRHATRHAPAPPAQHHATPTTNTATEDTQTRPDTPAATEAASDPVDANAEPGTQGEVTTQTQAAAQAPAATPPAPQQPAAAAQAQAQAQTPVAAGPTTTATDADVHAGVQVRDQTGGMVGTVESVDATGAVVATGTVRAKLPLTSFGRNNQGLVISLTRAQLEAAAQPAPPTPS